MSSCGFMPTCGVFLADGLTSARSRDRLDQLRAALSARGLDCATAEYRPHAQDGRVETTDVFPWFFGLRPDANPGRAGLELLLDGDLAPDHRHFIALREASYSDLEVFSSTDGGAIRASRYSADGLTFIASSSSASWIHALQHAVPAARFTHARTPTDRWFERSSVGSAFELIGWCHGGLLAALAHAGLVVPADPPTRLLPHTDRDDRLAELGRLVRRVRSSGRQPVLYAKDCAFAARHSGDLGAAVEFIADLAGRLLVNQTSPLLIISDHNSELGMDATLEGPTAWGLIWPERCTDRPLLPDRLTQRELVSFLQLVAP